MLQQPWFNFGLWLGEDAPTNDNVVRMTEPLFRAVPKDFLSRYLSVTQEGPEEEDLPLQYRRRAWKLLGRTGEPPRMRILVDREALDAIIKKVLEEEKHQPLSLVEQVQAKLDSYKTDDQRRQRLDALEATKGSTITIDIAIETIALKARLHHNAIIPLQELLDKFRQDAEAGKMPLYVTINGKTRKIPLEVVRRGRRPPA